MQFLKNIQKIMQAQVDLEDSLYSAVLEEVKSGLVMKDLWAKSMAHGDFDPDRSRAFYIRERVGRLKSKSKAIAEYLQLAAQEAEFEDISSTEKLEYDEARKAHERKIQELETRRKRLADEIAVECSVLSNKKNAAAKELHQEAAHESSKQSMEKKLYFTFGVALLVVTAVVVALELNPMIGYATGIVGGLVTLSGFVDTGSSDARITYVNKMLDEESPLEGLRERHQKLVDQIVELREQAPTLHLSGKHHDNARKHQLEQELGPLFTLERL